MACQDLKHGDRGVEGGERWGLGGGANGGGGRL